MNICWLDFFANLNGSKKRFLWSLVFVSCWYLVSVFPLLISGQLSLLTSFIWPLATVGFFTIFLSYPYFKKSIQKHISGIRSVVLCKHHPKYDALIENTFLSTNKNLRTFIVAALVTSTFFVFLIANWLFELGPIIFSFMGERWYSVENEGLLSRIVALTISVFPVFLLIVTGVLLMVRMLLLVREMPNFEFVSSPRLCTRQFRPTIKFLIFISLAFSSMAAFFLFLFGEDILRFDFQAFLYLAFTLGIILMGAAGVLYSTYIAKKVINQIRDNRLDLISNKIIELGSIDEVDQLNLTLKLYELEEQFAIHEKVDSFFIGWKYISGFLVSFLIPILVAMVQVYFELILKMP